MEFSKFLKHKRKQLELTQLELAERLTMRGEETSSGRIGHWETGRNNPPLEDPRFRDALAAALEMDINDLMATLGFVVLDEHRSDEALKAAEIIERLPSEAKGLALEYLELLEKRYVLSKG